MASIENRSRFIVTVRNRHDLTLTFSCKREKDLAGSPLRRRGSMPLLAALRDHGHDQERTSRVSTIRR